MTDDESVTEFDSFEPQKRLRNQDVVDRYITWCTKVRRLSPTTLRTYRSRLEHWATYRGRASVLTATRQDMEAWLSRERERRGGGTRGSAATHQLEGTILRSFYKWCHQEGLTHRDLGVHIVSPKVNNTNPRPISDQTWLSLWDRPLGAYQRVVLGLGFFCGLRRAELARLTPQQLTTEAIVNFPRKGGGEDTLRWTTVHRIFAERLPHLVVNEAWLPEAVDMWLHYRRSAPLLFPWRGDPQAVNRELSKWCKQANTAHVSPHQLRHSAASNLLRAGVPVMLVRSILNHSSVEITQRYIQASGSELDMWLEGRWGQ